MADDTTAVEPETEIDGATGDESFEDSILDQIFSSASDDNDASAPRNRTETDPKEQPGAESESDEGKGQPEAKGGDRNTSEAPEGAQPEDYQKAMGALIRDGMPRAQLDRLAKEDPDALIEWGLKRAEAQARVDSFGNENATLRKRLEELEAGGEAQSAEGAEATPEPELTLPAFQLDDTLKDTLSAQFGDDVIAPLQQIGEMAYKQAVNTVGHAVDRFMQVRDQRMQAMENHVIQTAIDRTLDRFATEYPQLQTGDVRQKVQERAMQISSDKYKSMDDLFRDAIRIEVGPEIAKEQQTVRTQTNKARSHGQMTTTSRTQGDNRSAASSADDLDDFVLDEMFAGKSADEIEAKLARRR